MSTETITVIVSIAGLLLTLAGGFAALFAWAMRRLDGRFDRVEDRMTKVEHELVEVKIGIARLEGPPRRLISAGS